MKTSSLWGTPPTRYYSFLKRVEESFCGEVLSIAIIGCSDGKFVLPAARRGHSVFAVDVDEIALFGGTKVGPDGDVFMPGLVSRLATEHPSGKVSVVHGDYFSAPLVSCFHAVFTSGAIQYSRNQKHAMCAMVNALKNSVLTGGFLYVDYMLPLEDLYKGRDNYPDRRQWDSFFREDSWKVLYNRVLPPQFEKAHVDKPEDHYHHWGHILTQRVGV